MPVYLPGLTFGGLGFGGAAFGYSPYGSGILPRPPVAVQYGYGGASYGTSPYGSTDNIPPVVTGANAIDGFQVEIFFSEALADEPNLIDPTNYSLDSLYGVTLTAVSVTPATPGPSGGYTSVIVTHTGSTLGGSQTVTVTGIYDLAGNLISPSIIPFYALGDATAVSVILPIVDDGRTVQVDFYTSTGETQDLLTEAEYSPGVDSLYSYAVTTDYPIAAVIGSATQTLLSRVALDLHPMTSTDYLLSVGPALAYNYTGQVLPNDDPSLLGVEVGTGESEPTSLYGLLMSKVEGVSYGWFFGDLSGRLLPNSTFKVSLQIDASDAVITPPVTGSTLMIFSVSDGSIQLDIYLTDLFGDKVIGIVSGGLSFSALAAWDLGPVDISLVRNQKGSFYTLLFNDSPLLTFPVGDATGVPTIGSGCQVLLNPAHNVQFFGLRALDITASSTLFTSTWNFIHSRTVPFVGSSVLTRSKVITKRGPLVRGWGDATPAQIQDVEVRVNGTPVSIASVNPYVGEITPSIPIPLTTPGTVNVEVDYIWFNNPVFELSGLNTKGLTLNNWGRAIGGKAISDHHNLGVAKTARFPMGVVLGPRKRHTPKQVGHRYIGFQRDGYSALLNQPTTLRLNQNPHAISVGKVNASAYYERGFFNGRTTPVDAGWSLYGQDTGEITTTGAYRIIDATSGPYGVGDAAYYKRSVDLSLPTVVNLAGRFAVESYSPDGVFTGVGFGLYTGKHILLIGALIVSGVKHLGILIDGLNPQLEASWLIGPAITGTVVTGNTIDIPLAKVYGNTFRIASGDQAGVYTLATCGIQYLSNRVRLTLNENLPGEETEVTLLFETLWDTLTPIRALVTTVATVYVGDTLIVDQVPMPAYPAQTALLLPVVEKGATFFGSISRRAENSSLWDMFQYISTPNQILNTVQGIYVTSEMSVLPQDETDPWYIQGGYGYAQVSGALVLSKSTSVAPGSKFAFERTEPYLSPKVTLDVEASFKVDSGRLGAGDVEIILNDTMREVSLKTLLYVQGTFPHPQTGLSYTGRSLVTGLPQASLSGLQEPVTVGWTLVTATGSPTVYAEGMYLHLDKGVGDTRYWRKSLPDPVCVSYSGLICEAQVQMNSGTEGFYFGARVKNSSGPNSRFVGLGFISGSIALLDRNFAQVTTFSYAWDDGLDHTYRVVLDPVANLVSIFIDDSLLGTETLTLFAANTESPEAVIALLGSTAVDLNLYSFSVIPLRPVARAGSFLGRTFGIPLRGGDPLSIDGYVIPRVDATKAKNSSLTAIPVQMDWQTLLQTRLYLDPSWGVSFYRPDIAAPPWFTGTFSSETTDPLAAWITVEYALLPLVQKDRGTIVFGSPDIEAITQSRWDYFRYRIRGDIDGFGIAPQNMVLNRAFTYTSAEYLKDKTPEVRTIKSRTATLVKVSDSAIYADRVFVVQASGSVLPINTWSFDKTSQVLVLTSPLPKGQYPVTVTFAPARPITATYLEAQPLDGSVTLLNDGTPSVPKSRDATATFIEVSEGEDIYIAPMCDGYGFAELALSGSMTSDAFGLRGSATHFYSGTVLIASGPGLLNQTILYPNARAQDWSPAAPFMGMNQDFWLALEMHEEDVFEPFSDNVSPSGIIGTYGHGIADYVLEDYSTSRYSRLGPWASLEALAERSFLGGGYPLTGSELTLSGGAPLYILSVITTGVLEAAN